MILVAHVQSDNALFFSVWFLFSAWNPFLVNEFDACRATWRSGTMTKRVVVASGYFNPLHYGHVSYLEKARDLGTSLIVIVNNDLQAVSWTEMLVRINVNVKSQIPTIGRFQCITHVSIKSIGILNVLRKNIERMELQCDFLPVSGSNSSAPCSASMPPWKPLMKTSQWLRRWDAWLSWDVVPLFWLFRPFFVWQEGYYRFQALANCCFFLSKSSVQVIRMNAVITGKGVMMSFV